MPNEKIVEHRQCVQVQPPDNRALNMHRLDHRLALEPPKAPGMIDLGQEPLCLHDYGAVLQPGVVLMGSIVRDLEALFILSYC